MGTLILKPQTGEAPTVPLESQGKADREKAVCSSGKDTGHDGLGPPEIFVNNLHGGGLRSGPIGISRVLGLHNFYMSLAFGAVE